ncbi:MAG: hypothetical protein GZ094_10355 [Mariniphaga sp.]|nr:hypothetical protein [Mariniphaga sp.]
MKYTFLSARRENLVMAVFINETVPYNGDDFDFLSKHTPDSVIVAEGSPVTVDWKRTSFEAF